LKNFLTESQKKTPCLFRQTCTYNTLIATIGGYLSGLVITPLICFFILGASLIHPMKIFLILTELVIVPIIVSRILIYKGLDTPILPFKGLIALGIFYCNLYHHRS
jgi:hypothetical protein